MAIYQYYLAVIPKIGLIKKHGQIPNSIPIGSEAEWFESNTEEYWQLADVSSDEIVSEIDKLVKRSDWDDDTTSVRWKTYSEDLDNDGWMSINEQSKKIQELSFRADLREKNLTFLVGMLDLSNKHNFILMDRKGNLANPNFEEIKKLIEISNPYKFLQDPKKFLTDLGEGRIKPE